MNHTTATTSRHRLAMAMAAACVLAGAACGSADTAGRSSAPPATPVSTESAPASSGPGTNSTNVAAADDTGSSTIVTPAPPPSDPPPPSDAPPGPASTDEPSPTVAVTAEPPPTPASCGPVGEYPPFVSHTAEIDADLGADGSDDVVLSYTSAVGWAMRVTLEGGPTSEILVGSAGNYVRVLGAVDFADGHGIELVAQLDSGQSGFTAIGFFGLDDDGCLFQFTDESGAPFTLSAGEASGERATVRCWTGVVGANSATLRPDGTWDAVGAGYERKSLSTMGYLPASDDISEGLETADLLPAGLDCDGVTL